MTDLHVDTGLTAAVTSPLPPVGLKLLKPEMPPNWTLARVSGLVRDLAMNLYDESVTLQKHGLTPEQFLAFKDNEFFQRALQQATLEWHSPHSTQKRLAMESAIAIEDALPTVSARLSAKNEPLSDVVALLKILSEMAGITGAKAIAQNAGTGEKFKIVINLGADTVIRDVTPKIEISHEEAPRAYAAE